MACWKRLLRLQYDFTVVYADAMTWFAAYVTSTRQELALRELKRFSVPVFFPQTEAMRRVRVRGNKFELCKEVRALFPGYLFADIPDRLYHPVSDFITPVSFDGEPVAISEKVMAFVRSLVGADGVRPLPPSVGPRVGDKGVLHIEGSFLDGMGAVVSRVKKNELYVLAQVFGSTREMRIKSSAFSGVPAVH